ncbi:MAG: CgeB family protein [Rhodospirillales bacterium]
MKIAFFGSSLVSAYWNGAATYYRGLLKALAERGHEITFYEPDAFDRQRHRDIEDPSWARVVVYPATEADVGRCLRHAAGADVIVKASGVGVFDALLEEAVLELRRPGARVAFWDVDAPATLERVEADPTDPFRALVPAYDVVFTYGGGPAVVAAYSALGARACIPIYNALDPSTHYSVEAEDRFRSDLTFIGNRLPDREARVEEFFLGVAERLPRRRFLIGGSGWDSRPLPSNVTCLGHVYTRDHNALNCSARAVLNVNRDSMARYGFSPPTRVFEAAGAGACLITDAWDGIEAFLAPGEEVLVAADGTEVAELLDGLSRRKARCIGEMARARVLAYHTYARRAAVVDAVLKGAVSAGAEAGR